MRWPVRVAVLFVAILTLTIVATPPLIEEHLEPGFCSADCPVQHDGQGAAIEPAPAPREARHTAVGYTGHNGVTDADPGLIVGPASPRAPPSA
jgi:hypothetical protein